MRAPASRRAANDGREELHDRHSPQTPTSGPQGDGRRKPRPSRGGGAPPAAAVEPASTTAQATVSAVAASSAGRLAAPTLMVGASLVGETVAAKPGEAAAGIPAVPELGRPLRPRRPAGRRRAADVAPGHGRRRTDGTADFALPRTEVGQGITTSTTMLIAEELDLPMSKVRVTLADARPELLFNQLTGGSNTTRSTYDAIRTAAALARGRLLDAAARKWGVDRLEPDHQGRRRVRPVGQERDLRLADRGRGASVLTRLLATAQGDRRTSPSSAPRRTGWTRLPRSPARRSSAMDLQVPDALPTMVAPAADDQRHPEVGVQPGRGQGHARRHRRRHDLHRRRGARAPPSASASTRSGH